MLLNSFGQFVFRLATCNDLISLKCKYPDYWFAGSNAWGLKQMGTLFCADKIEEIKPQKILEIGAGLNTFFDNHFASRYEYWMIDKAEFYNAHDFNQAKIKRKNTHFIEGLLGQFHEDLPENYFDILFSVSVLEHIPLNEVENVCKDMFRIVKPKGYVIHSLDISPESTQYRGQRFLKALNDHGFVFTEEPKDINWNIENADNQILFEPLEIIYTYYNGYREDMWTNPKPFKNYHFGTLLIFAHKT